MNSVHFSSRNQEWATPPALFGALDAEFGFTLDACASPENAKVSRYFTPEDDALSQRWEGVVWMNPPYGYGIGKWVEKAYTEAQRGSTVVALVPARTETAWWHDYVMRSAEVRMIRGRINFLGGGDGIKGHNAPFPCVVVVFREGDNTPLFRSMDRP